MNKTHWTLIPLLVLGMGLFSCSEVVDKAAEIIFPSPWGITSDDALGTMEKARAHMEEFGFVDDSDHSELNFIEHGTVHYFMLANAKGQPGIIVIADGDKILAIASAFKEHPSTAAKGIIKDLWKDLTGGEPKLEVTVGASQDKQATWTGTYSTDTVAGKWSSEGLIKTKVLIVKKEYASYL